MQFQKACSYTYDLKQRQMFILMISLFCILIILNPTQVIGNGSFGVVYQARLIDSQEMVAIKKVLQDKRFKVRLMSLFTVFYVFKWVIDIRVDFLWMLWCFPVWQNRELQIMRKLDHCNIVRLRYFFYSSGEKVQPFFPLRFQHVFSQESISKKYLWEHFFTLLNIYVKRFLASQKNESWLVSVFFLSLLSCLFS